MKSEGIRLTQYSHSAGCGCKIAPDVLSRILAETDGGASSAKFPTLLVGHQSRDDAAAVVLDNDRAVLSSTDFFMPIVDDPYDFGRIAATNAISDIYAMGGTPQLAVAILGWPIDQLAPEIANQVVQGGCASMVHTIKAHNSTGTQLRRSKAHSQAHNRAHSLKASRDAFTIFTPPSP